MKTRSSRLPAAALLLFAAALLLVSIHLRREAAAVRLPLSVGGEAYVLSLSPASPGLSLGPVQSAVPEVRPLRTRTVRTFPVISGGMPAGAVTLTLDDTAAGLVLYFASTAPGTVDCRIEAQTRRPASVRYCSYFGPGPSEPSPLRPLRRTRYGADTALYFSGGMNLYVSRLALLTPLGQTVCVREAAPSGAVVGRGPSGPAVSIPLYAKAEASASLTAVLTPGEPVSWAEEQARLNVKFLDADQTDYHLTAAGVYQTLPDTYRPRLPDGRPHVYRSAAAWLLGPCSYESNGPLFTALGHSILYSYLDAVNERGFLPTEPSSTWLSGEYAIGPGFYDTRFNFDTIGRLMRVSSLWNEPSVQSTVQAMLRAYLNFAAACSFTADGVLFTPDYGAADLTTPTSAACSLNHYLTEGLTLLEAGELFGDMAFTEKGLSILSAIDRSADRWIRPTGDLWYAIRPDGQMEKEDYVSVTYNDLISASRFLNARGLWSQYPGVQRLLQSKEAYLIANGLSHVVHSHPDFTL